MSRFDTNRDRFDRDFENFDKSFRKATKLGAVWFAICAIVSLVILGVGIWAVVAIVSWLTTK